MELAVTKILVLTLLGVLRLFFGLIPLKITRSLKLWGENGVSDQLAEKRKKTVDLIISFSLCFGGGVLLATCFIHMLPEIRESLEIVREDGYMPDSHFPFAELLVCIGFFLIYFLEEAVHRLFKNTHDDIIAPCKKNGPKKSNVSVIDNITPSQKPAIVEHEDKNKNVDPDTNIPKPNTHIGSLESVQSTGLGGVINNNYTRTTGVGKFTYLPDASLDVGALRNKQLSAKIGPTSASRTHLLASSLTLNEDDASRDTDVEQCSKNITNGNVHGPVSQPNGTPLKPRPLSICNGTDAPKIFQKVDLSKHGISVEHLKNQSLVSNLRSFLVVVALSFHSVFEGLAIGLQLNETDVWYLFAAISVHASAILFCIGLELVTTGTRLVSMVMYIVILALVSPLGVAIGIVVTENASPDHAVQSLVIAILQGIAAGTILYITFFEVLDREKRRDGGGGAARLVFILLGFAIMAGLEALGGHNHGPEHPEHDHNHDGDELLHTTFTPSGIES